MQKGTAMNQILLVAILTLPNTGHVVYEVAGAYPNRPACETARREQQRVAHTVPTGYICLAKDYN